MEQLYDLDFAHDVALLSHKNQNYSRKKPIESEIREQK